MNNAYTAFDQFETLGYRGVAIFGPDEQAAGDGAGKRPCSGVGWQDHAPETHRACLTSTAGRNVGILCAHGSDNTAIDIDCDFPEIAAVLETLPVLAWLPRRYGNKPRVLFPCKIKNVSDEGTVHDLTFRHADGREFTIQIIRGQYVAWGIHPKTRKPYEWVGNLPPSANLPYIDYAAFVRQAVEAMDPLGFTTKNDRPGAFAPLLGDLTDEEKRALIERGERIARGKAKMIDNGSDRRDTHVFAAASYWRALIEAGIVTEEEARDIIDDHLAEASPNYGAQIDQGLRKGNDTAFKELCARRAFFAAAAQQQAAYMAMQSPVAQPSPNVAHEVCEIAQIAQGFARNMAAYNCGLRCPENFAQDMRNAISQFDPSAVASFDTGLSHQHAAREAATGQRALLSGSLAAIAKYFDMTKARMETREISRILGKGGNIEVDEAALMAGAAGCDIALVAALRAGYEEGRSIASRDMKAEPATGDMIDDYSPFMINGLLDQGAMSVVFGASNAGKTFVLMDLAYRVAMGNKWRGRATSQATVIYVAAEGGRRIKKRVAALQKKYGKTKNFQLVRYPIDLCTSDFDLDKLTHLVLEALRETGSANCWVIVDTLARALAGGDENSSVDMGNVVRAADAVRAATGAHFTYVHHTGKDEARGLRGHSNLLGAVDTTVEVTPGAMFVKKQRDLPFDENAPIAFKLVESTVGNISNEQIKSAEVKWDGDDGIVIAPPDKDDMEGRNFADVVECAIIEQGAVSPPNVEHDKFIRPQTIETIKWLGSDSQRVLSGKHLDGATDDALHTALQVHKNAIFVELNVLKRIAYCAYGNARKDLARKALDRFLKSTRWGANKTGRGSKWVRLSHERWIKAAEKHGMPVTVTACAAPPRPTYPWAALTGNATVN